MEYWYLATPYRSYPHGLDAAYEEAAWFVGALLKLGRNQVYSPITNCHLAARLHGLDPVDNVIWERINAPFMEHSHGLLIAKMDGWKESEGIEIERRAFAQMGKPIREIHRKELEQSLEWWGAAA